MKKRIFALSMALLMLVSSVFFLVSCADKDTEQDNGTEESDLEHLNGLDFGGMDINFIVAEASASADDFNSRSIYVDEDAADDAVNKAIFERNKRVEELLGINIVLLDSFHEGIKAKIGAQLQAGISDYDVIAGRQWSDTALALDGVLLDLTTLDMYGNAAKYLNWDKEYWATSYIDTLSFGDSVYWVTGDICLRYSGGFYAFFVNSKLYEDMLYEEYGSIYQIVNDGKWTYDKLIEMISKCYEDDGDDKVGIEDKLGMLFTVCDSIDGMAVSAGVMYTRYEEGVPYNNITGGNKILIEFMDKCNELINTKGVFSYPPPSDAYATVMRYFAEGRSMFVVGRVNFAELYLREMQDDYYIIPCPKLNESQSDYYTCAHDALGIYAINHSIDDEHIEAAAATLEAMAYYSYKDVRPIYYDSFLKFKYTRDDEAWKMIDLMHDSVYTDFVFIWKNSDEMNDLHFFLRNNVVKTNPTSQIKKYVNSWNTGLEEILKRIEEMKNE